MFIKPNNPSFQYSGRIDFTDPETPVLVYAASFVKIIFSGKTCRMILKNEKQWARDSVGIFLDGVQGKIELSDDRDIHEYDISNAIKTDNGKDFPEDGYFKNITDGYHELMIFKRMDGGQHYVSFVGLELEEGAEVKAPAPLPVKKLEVIGDSVSCGEVCEAIDCVGKPDPENNEGVFSNSWYSYSWQVARNLDMELHDTSQGGISLLNGTGWFNMPDLRGVESSFDKLKYNPPLGMNEWDLNAWKPDVIILAFGQNDANPEDFMKNDYMGEKAEGWRAGYEKFIRRLQNLYPSVKIVCATTLLMHDPAWDKAIDEVVSKVNAEDAGKKPAVFHYVYKRNGAATPGHPRIPEHNEMAAEMTEFIRSIMN
ncbi:MAG: electron transporter RnfD [Lachnospiraceae bacterium]|nr:electron transporter RnfD [Lachnospiraceae bacterium]